MTYLVTFVLAFAIVLLVVASMAIGVINGRKPIRGSCGGIGSKGCELCSGDCDREERR
jgi:hypothetical protein